jgi:hypothetical protein
LSPQPAEPLTICKAYNKYPGSCGSIETEHEEVWYPRGRYASASDSDSRKCRKMISRLLCATCNPLAAHIFGSETGTAQDWPFLCQPFCERFFDACADVEINTDARVYVPFRIPGLSKNQGVKKIRDLYPTMSSYCSNFGSTDQGACHTGL